MNQTYLSVVLGTYNRLSFLRDTIDTIRKEVSGLKAEIIVIDGGSTDGTINWLVDQKDILMVVQHNRGKWLGRKVERKSWGYFMNLGFRSAKGKYVCMLSDDCLVVPGAIRNGIELFEKKLNKGEKIGALAFYWRDWPEETKYRIGLAFGDRMFVNHGLYLRKALEDVNYVDEESYQFYHADGDLCLRMWERGYKCVDSPDSYIEHHSHANKRVRKKNLGTQSEDWGNYVKRWGKLGKPKRDWVERKFQDPNETASRYWGRGIQEWFRRVLLR